MVWVIGDEYFDFWGGLIDCDFGLENFVVLVVIFVGVIVGD